MADLGMLGSAVSGGLQGLVEAYKLRLTQAEEAAKTRQSGFNAATAAGAAEMRALLQFLKPSGSKQPSITGKEFNALIGQTVFPDDMEVTSQHRLAYFQGKKQQQLGESAAKMVANIGSGIDAIGVIRQKLQAPGGLKTRTKAIAGNWPVVGGLITMGDTNAQDLLKAAGEAADVITRIRTGAALNKDEQKFYGAQFLRMLDTPEATEHALTRYENMFRSADAMIKSGRNIPPISKTRFLADFQTGKFGDENFSTVAPPGAPVQPPQAAPVDSSQHPGAIGRFLQKYTGAAREVAPGRTDAELLSDPTVISAIGARPEFQPRVMEVLKSTGAKYGGEFRSGPTPTAPKRRSVEDLLDQYGVPE